MEVLRELVVDTVGMAGIAATAEVEVRQILREAMVVRRRVDRIVAAPAETRVADIAHRLAVAVGTLAMVVAGAAVGRRAEVQAVTRVAADGVPLAMARAVTIIAKPKRI